MVSPRCHVLSLDSYRTVGDSVAFEPLHKTAGDNVYLSGELPVETLGAPVGEVDAEFAHDFDDCG